MAALQTSSITQASFSTCGMHPQLVAGMYGVILLAKALVNLLNIFEFWS
jgi:hypothetical protein